MALSDIKFQHRTECELKRKSCDDCRSHWRIHVQSQDYESNTGQFDIYFCNQCKLGFTEPYPTESTSPYLYETRESSDFDVVQGTLVDRIKDYLARRLLTSLSPRSPEHVRAVLDYSTGNGRFALTAAELFSNASVDAVDYGEQPPPLLSANRNRVNYIAMSSFNGTSRQYDLIVLRHVLEHNYHPIALLKALGERLTDTGIIYVEVPNLESGCARLVGRTWVGYYTPRHVFHFTRDSLRQAIELAGLEGDIRKNEMPLMGNTVAIFLGLPRSNRFAQICGIVLHPLQLLIEAASGSSTCINARCRKKSGKDSLA